MAECPRVALDVETSLDYGRQILDGVSRYMRAKPTVVVYVEQHDLGSDLNGLLKRWTGDGIITRQVNAESAKMLRRRQDCRRRHWAISMPHHGILRIGSADLTIGRIAADASCSNAASDASVVAVSPTRIGRKSGATDSSRQWKATATSAASTNRRAPA